MTLGARGDGSGLPDGLQGHIDAMNAADPVRNLRIFMAPDEALVDAGEVWRPSWPDQIGGFRVPRRMDMQMINSSAPARNGLSNIPTKTGPPIFARHDWFAARGRCAISSGRNAATTPGSTPP